MTEFHFTLTLLICSPFKPNVSRTLLSFDLRFYMLIVCVCPRLLDIQLQPESIAEFSRSRYNFDLSLALWVTNSRKMCMYLLRHLAPLCSDLKLWKLDNISSFSSLEKDVGEDILFEMWSIDTEGQPMCTCISKNLICHLISSTGGSLSDRPVRIKYGFGISETEHEVLIL